MYSSPEKGERSLVLDADGFVAPRLRLGGRRCVSPAARHAGKTRRLRTTSMRPPRAAAVARLDTNLGPVFPGNCLSSGGRIDSAGQLPGVEQQRLPLVQQHDLYGILAGRRTEPLGRRVRNPTHDGQREHLSRATEFQRREVARTGRIAADR